MIKVLLNFGPGLRATPAGHTMLLRPFLRPLLQVGLQKKLHNAILLLSIVVFLGGCASAAKSNAPVYDPFENVNRKIFSFNQSADKYVLRPVAQGYARVVPDPIEAGVINFFENLQDVTLSLIHI